MKTLFLVLLFVHGSIHLLGFVKAFQLADVNQLTQSITKPAGVLWLLTALLLIGGGASLLLHADIWWILAGLGLVCSQVLIVMSWSDAKYGTVLNIVVLLPVYLSMMSSLPSSFPERYAAEVRSRLASVRNEELLTEQDILHLPVPVQRYLRYTGAIGKQKVFNFRAVNHGSMRRGPGSGWMEITAQQYNFYDDRARLFYIESALFGVPFDGLHTYLGTNATMEIKVASTVEVVNARGEEMNRGETVTMFNDMCLFAPSTLIDKSIQWELLDSARVKAVFTNHSQSISAVLTFNEAGALANFTSNDRYLSADGKTYLNYPWSTPVREYKDFDGRKIASYAEAIWNTPEGEYVYARYHLTGIEYNCRTMQWE